MLQSYTYSLISSQVGRFMVWKEEAINHNLAREIFFWCKKSNPQSWNTDYCFLKLLWLLRDPDVVKF